MDPGQSPEQRALENNVEPQLEHESLLVPTTSPRLNEANTIRPRPEVTLPQTEISESVMFAALQKPGEYQFRGPLRIFDGALRYVDQDVVISSKNGWPTVDCVGFAIHGLQNQFFSTPKQCWDGKRIEGYAITPGKSPGQSTLQVIINLHRDITDENRMLISHLTKLGAHAYREAKDSLPDISCTDPIASACDVIMRRCHEIGLEVCLHRGRL